MNTYYESQLQPIYKGDTATIGLKVLQDNGKYMNFNGKTIKFIVKKSKNETDNESIIYKTYEPTTNVDNIDISLSEDETNKTPGMYLWSVRVLYEGQQITEGEGKLEIKQGVFYGK